VPEPAPNLVVPELAPPRSLRRRSQRWPTAPAVGGRAVDAPAVGGRAGDASAVGGRARADSGGGHGGELRPARGRRRDAKIFFIFLIF
jgi:hypothetical protein